MTSPDFVVDRLSVYRVPMLLTKNEKQEKRKERRISEKASLPEHGFVNVGLNASISNRNKVPVTSDVSF